MLLLFCWPFSWVRCFRGFCWVCRSERCHEQLVDQNISYTQKVSNAQKGQKGNFSTRLPMANTSKMTVSLKQWKQWYWTDRVIHREHTPCPQEKIRRIQITFQSSKYLRPKEVLLFSLKNRSNPCPVANGIHLPSGRGPASI